MTQTYGGVTERPGTGASREQLSMLYTRYHIATEFCAGKEVLEVGCGAGPGLGYLARRAKRVVGGDIDSENVAIASQTYWDRNNIEVRELDAEMLPFADQSFDTVILFEAIYYLNDAVRFISEASRVLREKGVLIVGSVNCEWPEFHPSPFSTRYFSAGELQKLFSEQGFQAEIYGAFLRDTVSFKGALVSGIKRAASRMHLIPDTMQGKELLKRVFFGKLKPIPNEVTEGMTALEPLVKLPPAEPVRDYKNLFAVGHKISLR